MHDLIRKCAQYDPSCRRAIKHHSFIHSFIHSLHLDPELTLDDVRIEVVQEFKFLGLLFDSKLSFIPHINYLSNKCQKAINLLRVVSSMDWGADRKVLLRLYRSLVRSKLDYGCVVYGSARQSYLRKLDSIHNQGLRLALGAFRTSPVNSLSSCQNDSSNAFLRKIQTPQKLFMPRHQKFGTEPQNFVKKPFNKKKKIFLKNLKNL